MLRTFHPIVHPIFTLHSQLENLVCLVWCNANNNNTCAELLDPDFEPIYNSYDWLKVSVDEIYEKCKLLTGPERADIREAFNVNNRIEEMCEGTLSPIGLNNLPTIVKTDMKPLLKEFYTRLLDLAQVAGDKLDYYNQLIVRNNYKTCPCCGISPIEPAENHYREDNDHYLPKADFPFATVNFKNLVPLCGKCNKKCKGEKNPFAHGRVSYFPFGPVYHEIEIQISLIDNINLDYTNLLVDEIIVNFNGDANKNATWDWLYSIKERYNYEVRSFSKTELRAMSNRLFRNDKRKQGMTYKQIIDDVIEDYGFDLFEDRKFLKSPFLQAIKTKPEWMAVYMPQAYN